MSTHHPSRRPTCRRQVPVPTWRWLRAAGGPGALGALVGLVRSVVRAAVAADGQDAVVASLAAELDGVGDDELATVLDVLADPELDDAELPRYLGWALYADAVPTDDEAGAALVTLLGALVSWDRALWTAAVAACA
ncbi:MAG TPA: hypothetical protein VKV25_09535 [Acidimicrobiales bacterium]|nr:hypothetical protein [Acidimicrobiales bacterium]